MNNISLIGNITKNHELKVSKNNKTFLEFTLAVPKRKNKDKTNFIDCIVFGKAAELIVMYTGKGSKIFIQGELDINDYQQNGVKRRKYKVLVTDFEFIEYLNKNNGSIDQDFPF